MCNAFNTEYTDATSARYFYYYIEDVVKLNYWED